MTHTEKHEAIQAEIVLPEPFTGAHYTAWVQTFNQVEGNVVLKSIAATLAIIERGFYVVDGVEHDLKARGLDAPLHILVWAQQVASAYVAERMSVPKP